MSSINLYHLLVTHLWHSLDMGPMSHLKFTTLCTTMLTPADVGLIPDSKS